MPKKTGSNKKFYITTAIPYVNAAPHVGFAMEAVQADALTRYHAMKGDETYFLTGVDEHGVKLYDTAKAAGKDTQAFADENAEKFKALKKILNLSNDGFIRTTSAYHKKGAQKLWTALFDGGDIYKGVYKGNYCSGCEAFIADKDLVDGKCPNHDRVPQVLEEENYFFKLSKYSGEIRGLIESDKLLILPESRKNEMLNLIGDGGLRDVSFSRPKSVLPWGIDVPGDDSQVMYVWCDALSNYITALGYGESGEGDGVDVGSVDGEGGSVGIGEDATGAATGSGVVAGGFGGELFKKFWPADAHLIGKDILRFHAGVWIGMLLSAGLPVPKAVYVHGFVTSEGKKMSKSIGNVVDPLAYVDEFGVDALRYYLLREIPTGDDGDFSRGRFIELYNSELANNYGNLVSRIFMMVERYCECEVHGRSGKDFAEKIAGFWKGYDAGFENFNIKSALDSAVALIDFGNKYVDEQKPWALAKVDMEATEAALFNLLAIVLEASTMLSPVIPLKAASVLERLQVLKDGFKVTKGDVLFPKIEVLAPQ